MGSFTVSRKILGESTIPAPVRCVVPRTEGLRRTAHDGVGTAAAQVQ